MLKLTPEQKAALTRLQARFQRGAENFPGLAGALIEQPGVQSSNNETTLRFTFPRYFDERSFNGKPNSQEHLVWQCCGDGPTNIEVILCSAREAGIRDEQSRSIIQRLAKQKQLYDYGNDCYARARYIICSFFSFVQQHAGASMARHIGVDATGRLAATLDDSRTTWREFSRHAAEAGHVLKPALYQSVRPSPNGWITQLLSWGQSLPLSDFRATHRNQEPYDEFLKHKGRCAFLERLPSKSEWIACTFVSDLWSQSAAFCESLCVSQDPAANELIYTADDLPAQYRDGGKQNGKPLILAYLIEHRDLRLTEAKINHLMRGSNPPSTVWFKAPGTRKQRAFEHRAIAAYAHELTIKAADNENAGH